MRLKNVKGANEIIVKGKYYVSDAASNRGKWSLKFGNNNPIKIEIGMGKGDFIIENALQYPDVNFIGIEKYDSVIVRAIQKSNELELNNLFFIRMDATYIEDVFANEIDTIYLNFSDPWPKDRHAKRRLTSPNFLKRYDGVFAGVPHIVMKTDNRGLFDYSKTSLVDYGYDIIYATNDLAREHEIDNIMTEYEKKFTKLGVKINKLEAVKKSFEKNIFY